MLKSTLEKKAFNIKESIAILEDSNTQKHWNVGRIPFKIALH